MRGFLNRRVFLVGTFGAALAGLVGFGRNQGWADQPTGELVAHHAKPSPKPKPTPSPTPVGGGTLVWSPNPAVDGLGAFEGIEDNVGGGGGAKHIFADASEYRWIMDTTQRNPPGDRQRNEVKGMRAHGTVLTMGLGEHWRITYSMLIPHTMVSTGRFFHINQFKRPGTGTGPLATTSIVGNTVALRAFTSNVTVATVP